jgi:carboxyl-terminal processing protease
LLSRFIRVLIAAVTAAGIAYAQATPPPVTQHELDVASFVYVWESIRDTHWQKAPGGLDWQEIREEYEPRVNAAKTRDEVRTILSEMLLRLGQTHFGIIPAGLYTALSAGGGGSNVTGIDLRILDDKVLVTEVVDGSPADVAGVRPGWILIRTGEEEVGPLIQAVRLNKSIPGNLLELALASNFMRGLSGPPGSTVKATFLNAEDKPVELVIPLAPPRGEISQFGNLPPLPVFYEEKRFGEVTYVRFNAFLDLQRVIPSFQASVEGCKPCRGMIIDLRGNGGGIGAMAMGMAGFLISEPNQRLGTMHMRGTDLNFVVNPRLPGFGGPVAVLIDSHSASTSEIFAGGLQDLGRARIFGTRSAAAALPSAIERLPNGDGFQHAIATYISEGGQVLEGNGVIPDVVVELKREDLLQGVDAVLEAALTWIETQ